MGKPSYLRDEKVIKQLIEVAGSGASWEDIAAACGLYKDKRSFEASVRANNKDLYARIMRARAEAKIDALRNMQSGLGGHSVYNWFRLVNNDPYYTDIDKKLDREVMADTSHKVKDFMRDIEDLRIKAVERAVELEDIDGASEDD